MAGTATVFDMTDFTVTTCAAENYTRDFEIPIMKGWRKGDIYSHRFLQGLMAGFDDQEHDAHDQTIIMKGSQVTVIEKSQYQKVKMDRSTYIVKKEELKVDDERKVEIKKDDSLGVKGNYKLEVKEDVEILITGGLLQTVIGAKLVNEVSEWIEWKGKEMLTLGVVSTSINLLGKADIFGGATDVGLAYKDFILIEHKSDLLAVRQNLVNVKQQILESDAVALAAKLGGAFLHALFRMHA
jgi:hypothetical protein